MPESNLARVLALIEPHTSASPINGRQLARLTGLPGREVKRAVMLLRDAGYAIGSSRRPPAGYFLIRNPDEMEEFVVQYVSQAVKELRIARRMTARNFPELAGQLRLGFATEGDDGPKQGSGSRSQMAVPSA